MYRIGELANICKVSQKAIRFYEKKGLIKPIMVNDETGYRYYNDESIIAIEKIKNLKKIGLSLKEIKSIDLNSGSLDKYIDQRYKELQIAIRTLYLFNKSEKGELTMKNFVNDEKVIGKWQYVGSVKNKGSKIEDIPFYLNEIIFLENGQGYWLINAWSKGEIYVYPGEYPIPVVYSYEIDGDKLFVSVVNDKTNEFERIAVYSRVDNKKYALKDLERHDNIDVPFIKDDAILGLWNGIAMVNNPGRFIANNKNFPSFIYDLKFENNGNLAIRYTDGRIANQKWTKGLLLDNANLLASKYEIKNIDGKDYMFVENKNSDYIYNGNISSYFVFERN